MNEDSELTVAEAGQLLPPLISSGGIIGIESKKRSGGKMGFSAD